MTQSPGITPHRLALFCVAGFLLIYGCNAGNQQQEQQPVQPAGTVQAAVPPGVSINALMVAWIDHSGHALWDIEKEGGAPQTDADWRELERHAIQLVASATLISVGGTGEFDNEWAQEPTWATRAEALRHAALSDLNAVRQRNFEQVVRSNGLLTDSCEGCHEEFKPSLPSEGITHQPY